MFLQVHPTRSPRSHRDSSMRQPTRQQTRQQRSSQPGRKRGSPRGGQQGYQQGNQRGSQPGAGRGRRFRGQVAGSCRNRRSRALVVGASRGRAWVAGQVRTLLPCAFVGGAGRERGSRARVAGARGSFDKVALGFLARLAQIGSVKMSDNCGLIDSANRLKTDSARLFSSRKEPSWFQFFGATCDC